jgi:S1-C subfamily serine protease
MKYLTFFLAACISLAPSPSEDYSPQRPHETVSKSMSTAEKNIRVAAVKVSTPRGGHGSGSIVRYKDVTIVITAQHVASDALGTNYLISKNGLGVLSTLIYSNEKYDIAVLYLPDKAAALIDAKPMAWNTVEDYDVGTDILYSGYPSFHKLMSFDGRSSSSKRKNYWCIIWCGCGI